MRKLCFIMFLGLFIAESFSIEFWYVRVHYSIHTSHTNKHTVDSRRTKSVNMIRGCAIKFSGQWSVTRVAINKNVQNNGCIKLNTLQIFRPQLRFWLKSVFLLQLAAEILSTHKIYTEFTSIFIAILESFFSEIRLVHVNKVTESRKTSALECLFQRFGFSCYEVNRKIFPGFVP